VESITGSGILGNGFLQIALSCYKPFELQMLKSYNSLDKVPNLPKHEEEFKFIIWIEATKLGRFLYEVDGGKYCKLTCVG
jgi:hypothetical protein